MSVHAGTDIVSVPRVARLIEHRGSAFLHRWFTDDEISYCSAKAKPTLHFAARLAAKEAVVKAIQAAGDGPLAWRSIEIGRDDVGAPVVRLSGRVLDEANGKGISDISISMSHCQEFATAVAIADRPA